MEILTITLLISLVVLMLIGLIMFFQLEDNVIKNNDPICDELERCEYCDVYPDDDVCQDYIYINQCPEIFNTCIINK
jgi:hypothetical protein